MQTLSYGVQKPANNDTGDVFFPAIAANAQKQNDHTHDGANSAPLASTLQQALPGNWGATIGNGLYRQGMTVPAGLSFDTCEIWVRRSTGERVYPTIERTSATQFWLYTNDNSLTYNVYYR